MCGMDSQGKDFKTKINKGSTTVMEDQRNDKNRSNDKIRSMNEWKEQKEQREEAERRSAEQAEAMDEYALMVERRKIRSEEIRRRRIRQLRKRMAISAGVIVCVALGATVVGMKVRGTKKQEKAEQLTVTESLEKCYTAFVKESQAKAAQAVTDTSPIIDENADDTAATNSATADDAQNANSDAQTSGTDSSKETETSSTTVSKKEAAAFAAWMEKTYPEETSGKLLDKVKADGTLSEKDIYDAVGSTMHVLKDQYEGKLKDTDTAKENHIYLKDGAKSGEVQISAAGDLCLEEDGYVLDYYNTVNGDLKQCISSEILDKTNSADLFFLNHEYTISDKGTPLEDKYYVFRAKPERMSILKDLGTDIVSLANNHVYDYGADALNDTADLLDEAEIAYVGGGRNKEEAEQPTYYIINGIKIGFVAASEGENYRFTPAATDTTPGIMECYDATEYNKVIAQAASECDYLIAYVHWGTEDDNQYTEQQTTHGKEFLASGADIVIGGHPHVLQGIEYTDDGPIVYSLGDFWFNDETKYTGLLNLNITVDGLQEMSFTPCLQSDYQTQYLTDTDEQRNLYDRLEALSPNISVDDNGVITENTSGASDTSDTSDSSDTSDTSDGSNTSDTSTNE